MICEGPSAATSDMASLAEVLSDVAETENLGESLFTRLVTQGVRLASTGFVERVSVSFSGSHLVTW